MRRSNARARINSGKSNEMDPVKLYARPNTRTTLFGRGNSKNGCRSNYLIVISISVLLGLILLCLFVFKRSSLGDVKIKYGIIIDGGSTGTRIHVFKYKVDGANAVFYFEENGLVSMRTNPGLSSFADKPDGAGESLRDLIEFGKSRVPKDDWRDTEIRLMATAGMRLLELGVQEKILESCRTALRSSEFRFRDEWASVISGSDEGVYAWVVANYALGTLGHDPSDTRGIIELGGASAQVTFVSSETMPSEFSRFVKIGNTTYNLYSHSFLHFGQNVAYDLLREAFISGEINLGTISESLQKKLLIDPCTPKGYADNVDLWNLSRGTLDWKHHQSTLQTAGNFSDCRSAALMFLQKGKEQCLYNHCIGSTFIPKLRGRFMATENFFHTSKFFGLGSTSFLSDLMNAGQQFCGEEWSKLKKKYSAFHEEELLHYCFSSAYIVALLHDSLGIALDDERIEVANQVGSTPLDWALGAFILQSTTDLDVLQPDRITAMFGDKSTKFMPLIAVLVLVIFSAWTVSRLRKPQFKTIYDLEKGRYIVTRVGRS